MDLRFPAPLGPGDRIGVTSPSSGASGSAAVRIDFCVAWLRRRGFEVEVGDCVDGSAHIIAPREARAAELTAIDLVDLLDYDAIADPDPVLGSSLTVWDPWSSASRSSPSPSPT